MEKSITLRFPAKCLKCGEALAAGTRAIWTGKGKGVRHIACVSSNPPEIEKPKETGNTEDMVIDFAELRELWRKFSADPMSVYSRLNREAGTHLKGLWSESYGRELWAGCSEAEMADFLARGYRVEGMDGLTSLLPAKPRRRLKYAEEGDELLLDLAYAGVDEPFTEWEKRVSKPGLSVEIHMVFSSSFPAKVITQYQRWIARALQTLDENGVDMEVNIVNSLEGLYHENRIRTQTKIRVRKPGEASDFANWSAMFSPGGYRMLGILATGIQADRYGKTIGYGYGSVRDYGSWTVAYDTERNVIVIGNHNGGGREFPESEMTDKLRSILASING